MIDFKNSKYFKLKQTDNEDGIKLVAPLLIDGEEVLYTYRGIRDCVIFTNKRVISANLQGVTGKKRDFTSLPYSKITTFSVETSGVLDFDSELQLWFSGVGIVTFEFTGKSNIIHIGKIIASYAL